MSYVFWLKINSSKETTFIIKCEREGEKEMVKKFSDRLQEGLTLRNMTPSELALKSGLAKSSISEYLAGEYQPKQKSIYKMAKALSVEPSWLIFDLFEEAKALKYKEVPLLLDIRRDAPLYKYQEGYLAVTNEEVDYALKITSDLMSGSRIHTGDIVLVSKKAPINNGDIIAGEFQGVGPGIGKYYKYGQRIVLRFDKQGIDELECKATDIVIYGRVMGVQFSL